MASANAHRFAIGDKCAIICRRSNNRSSFWNYVVTKRFPGPGGKFLKYRIKHPTEPHVQRIVWESELSAA